MKEETKSPAKKQASGALSFEAALVRLRAISEQLERGGLPVDDAIALFEESVRLSGRCMAMLKEKRGKVFELKKELDALTETEL